MPENDQTRWVGIRPVNPAEDIPVLAQKKAPAISDLQAIKLPFQDDKAENNEDCTVEFVFSLTPVPAGELWVVTQIAMVNLDSMCDLQIKAKVVGVSKVVDTFYSVPAGNYVSWSGFLVLPEGGKIVGYVYLGGVSDDVKENAFGYKVGVY